jgi:hypothetical protein
MPAFRPRKCFATTQGVRMRNGGGTHRDRLLRPAPALPPRNDGGTTMFDLTTRPMDLYGAFTALLVFGIFIGTWWYYGMRHAAEHHA